eukprot:TRINITY_DN90885_c0_g1_i1.p1 TRINITY_DN90885_c0_g1~~TRINITY_DN90885_c0_g1_i1.p1  ORF type:complete len:1062 (+),score=130.51 TRINITY_DN90885_c0_g1_i1:37-3222(+)
MRVTVRVTMAGSESVGLLESGEAANIDAEEKHAVLTSVVQPHDHPKNIAKGEDEETGCVESCLNCLRSIRDLLLHPPSIVEFALKIAVAWVLYSLAICFCLLLLLTAMPGRLLASRSSQIGQIHGVRNLMIDLTSCNLVVSSVAGRGANIIDSSLSPMFSDSSAHVTLTDGGGCLIVTCTGPSSQQGYMTSAHLELGQDVELNDTSVQIETASRSSLILLQANYGNKLKIKGIAAVIMLESVVVPEMELHIGSGLLDIRDSQISHGDLTVGSATVSIQTMSSVSTQLHVSVPNGVERKLAHHALCLSDVEEQPKQTNNGMVYELGGNKSHSVLKVVRGRDGKMGQLFFSRGVGMGARDDTNTLDTTEGSGFSVEAEFTSWAQTIIGAQSAALLRLHVVGPGLDNKIGAPTAKADWVYSSVGDPFVWHSMSHWLISTAGIWGPPVARGQIVLTSGQCIKQNMEFTVEAKCERQIKTEEVHSASLRSVHAALWQALPPHWTAANKSKAELYLVQAKQEVSGFVYNSIVDSGKVTKFSPPQTAGSGMLESQVSLVANSHDDLMFPRDYVFAWTFLLIVILMPISTYMIFDRWFKLENYKLGQMKIEHLRRRLNAMHQAKEAVVKSDACPACNNTYAEDSLFCRRCGVKRLIPAPAATPAPEHVAADETCPSCDNAYLDDSLFCRRCGQKRAVTYERAAAAAGEALLRPEVRRLVTEALHPFAIMDSIVLGRLPDTSKVDGLWPAVEIVLFHFSVIIMLCFPLLFFAYLRTSISLDKHSACSTIDMIQFTCQEDSNALLPMVVIGFVISILVFMMNLSIVVYWARHIDNMAQPGTRLSANEKWLLRLRAAPLVKCIFWLLTSLLVASTSVYVVAFVCYIILGALVEPSYLVPILMGVVSVGYVVLQTYTQLQQVAGTLEAQFRDVVANISSGTKDKANLIAVTEEALHELGFSQPQIVFITVLAFIKFVAFVLFILIGVAMFMDTSSLIPALLSSGLVLVTAQAQLASGNYGSMTGLGSLDTLVSKLNTIQEEAATALVTGTNLSSPEREQRIKVLQALSAGTSQ